MRPSGDQRREKQLVLAGVNAPRLDTGPASVAKLQRPLEPQAIEEPLPEDTQDGLLEQPGMDSLEPEALGALPEAAQDDLVQRQDWQDDLSDDEKLEDDEAFEEVLEEEQVIEARQSRLRHYVNVLEAKQARADVVEKSKELASASSGLLREDVPQAAQAGGEPSFIFLCTASETKCCPPSA